ncbi:hypothetical protein O181_018137 [Austropuccinia psidii MF-1]|uniref:Uncharacterized protein n=1 Tax=Austropuccinia psidii MF-1 TaxID=1389203 RepID=A0A9Q3GT82_9BASI|nr:hypothetical protein [Austropuccinia psidii MF-1]
MEGAETSRKEGRGPRRLNSFLGVVCDFTGISRTTLKGLVEDDARDEENYAEEEEYEDTEVVPDSVGESKDTGRPTLA